MPKKKGNRINDKKKTKIKNNAKNKKENDNLIEIKEIINKKQKTFKEKKALIHNNPFQSNETIIKSIVDKLINLSVHQSFLNSVNKKLEDYYFDYTIRQINTLFATNNIYYCDEPEIEHCDKKELFWNRKHEICNTWVELTEPNRPKCDRFENAFMNYINYAYKSTTALPSLSGTNSNTDTGLNINRNNKDNLNDIKIKNIKNYHIRGIKNKENNSQKILDILEEKSSSSSGDENKKIKSKKSNNNIFNKSRNSLKNKTIHNENIVKKNSKQNVFSKINLSNNKDNKKDDENKKEEIPEMNHKDIPEIEKEYNYEKYDPPDVSFLRKEMQEEIIKKEMEEKKNTRNKEMMIINIKKEKKESVVDVKNNKKIFDSNKFSFDSNGKIINFKPIKIDSLIKDFAYAQNSIKTFDNTVKHKKIIKKKKAKNKGDESNKSKSNTKENVIKNPEDDPNGINKHNYVKITDKNEIITPSGSNFSLMLPNIGVILKENEKIKEGNREFGSFFKKYSIKEYDKILKDYVPIQNKTMLKNKMNQSMNNINMNLTTTKKIPKELVNNTNNSFKMNTNNTANNLLISTSKQNYNNINNQDLANPLINQADTIQQNDLAINRTYQVNNELNINNNNNSINNSSLFKSIKSYKNQSNSMLYSSGFSAMRNGSLDNIGLGVIRLKKNNSSLKNELDSLKDLNDQNINFIFPSNTNIKHTRNIFHSNYRNLFYKEKSKNDTTKNSFNEFNKKIMSIKDWGNRTLNKNLSTGNLHFGKHLTKYQALRELGSNLLNGIKVKLPRDRKVDIKI